jgi:hypothetical protein
MARRIVVRPPLFADNAAGGKRRNRKGRTGHTIHPPKAALEQRAQIVGQNRENIAASLVKNLQTEFVEGEIDVQRERLGSYRSAKTPYETTQDRDPFIAGDAFC